MTVQNKPEKHPFVVMAKPVGSRCNMQCSYCYYLKTENRALPDESRAAPPHMSQSILEKMIRQTIEVSPGPAVSFIWHGGEPTLAGIDFYQNALDLEKRYLPRGWQAWNNLQTNSLLLDDRWCHFLKENQFDVGISLDGSKEAHDRNRPDLGRHGTWERVCKSIRRLQDVGLQPDLLCTVNAASVENPLAIYRALRDQNTGWIQFIPIVVRRRDGTFSAETVTPEAYGDFLCAVFDEWAGHDLGQTDVQLFAEMARIMAGGSASACTMAPTCGRVLIVEADGSVYSCDHFVNPDHRLGSLKTRHLDDLADSPPQLAFGNAKRDALTAECRRCPWLSFCNGGCPKDRFGVSEDGEPGQYYLCRGLKQFFSHAQKPMKRILRLSRQGDSPQQIMEKIRPLLCRSL